MQPTSAQENDDRWWWEGDRERVWRVKEEKRTCVGGCQTEISQLNEVRTNIYALPLSEWRRCCSAATTLEITERNNYKRWSRMLLCLCCCCCCQAHHTFAIFALVFFFLCLLLSFFLVLQCNKMHANQSKRLVDSSQLCAWCCHIIWTAPLTALPSAKKRKHEKLKFFKYIDAFIWLELFEPISRDNVLNASITSIFLTIH